ncbi:MAG: SEC-C metal-binding domain-containing protein [bacterium]
MKNIGVLCVVAILSCILVTLAFVGMGVLISFFLPLTPFQTAMLLMAPFCCILILFPLLMINQKIEDMMRVMEEDYMYWDDEEWAENRGKTESKRPRTKSRKGKIIVMGSSPMLDRNAPCPCGSGKKYKNCCEEHGKTTTNEGD